MGFVTDAIGLTDHKGAKKAQKAAAQQAQQSYELSLENIEFQREQYADWQNIFGPIQDNLGDYYKNLSADKITTLGLENQQREFQNMSRQLNQQFAQRGISPDSAVSASTTANLGFANATERARIRTAAPGQAAQEKLGFLAIGMGQGQALAGNIGAAYTSGSSNLAGLSANNNQVYNSMSQANMSAMQQLAGTVTGYTFGLPTQPITIR